MIEYTHKVGVRFKLIAINHKCVVLLKIGEKKMKLISKETKTVKSAFNDEFENYLKKQQIKTTFNGYEIESFSWYRKALGLA